MSHWFLVFLDRGSFFEVNQAQPLRMPARFGG
jgi:hypothetical protein